MSLSALRPLSLGELLDGAFTLYRRHFSTFASTSLLLHLPVLAIWAAFGVFGKALPVPATVALMVAAVIARWGAAILAAGALTHLASAAYLGQTVDSGAAIATARRRFFTLWGTLFLQGIAIGLGFLLLVVPGLIFAAMFFAMVPAVMLEAKSSTTSEARSRELSAGAIGPILLALSVITIISWLPAMGLSAAWPLLGSVLPGGDFANAGAQQILTSAGQALALPLQFIGITLLYYDRRVRTEALDLELSAETVPIGAPALA